jgi:hypothetical protein
MVLLCLYYVGTHGVLQGKFSGDGLFGFEYLRAIVYQQTIDMQSVLPEWRPYFGLDPLTHHMPNRCPIGPVFVWMPFYLLACGLARLGELTHLLSHLRPNSLFHGWMAGLGTLAAVLIGYRHTYRLLERRIGRPAARLGATVAVWATPIAWYAVTQPMYQHGCAFGCVALLLDYWDETLGDDRPRRFVWLGLVGGLAMMMRPQEALFLLLPGGEILYRLARGPRANADRRRWFVGGVVLVASTLLAFSPQLLAWHFYTGAWKPVQVEPLRWGTPMFLVALFSTRSGLFPWSPIAYAALFGLLLARRARVLVVALTCVFAVELYICACAWVPSGAYSYGARRLSDAAPLLGLGMALLYDRVQAFPWRRRLSFGFAGLCIGLTLFTMEMQRTHSVPSSGGYARIASRYLIQVSAPGWMQRFFERVGYPFVQPAGYLFALWHHVPVYSFEGVVGNFQLDRDGQWFTVLPEGRSLPLVWAARANIVGGLQLDHADKAPALVTGPVRLLLSMFASEKIGVRIPGQLAAGGPLSAVWNGTPVAIQRTADAIQFEVPAAQVKAGVNELTLDVPVGSRLKSLDFTSLTKWW